MRCDSNRSLDHHRQGVAVGQRDSCDGQQHEGDEIDVEALGPGDGAGAALWRKQPVHPVIVAGLEDQAVGEGQAARR